MHSCLARFIVTDASNDLKHFLRNHWDDESKKSLCWAGVGYMIMQSIPVT